MRPVTPDQLLRANTEEEVVALVRFFLASWHPEELSEIPAGCRPGKVRDAEDIGDLAYELARARIAASGPQHLLTEMEAFFAQACSRLSGLEAARSHQPGSRSSSSPSSARC